MRKLCFLIALILLILQLAQLCRCKVKKTSMHAKFKNLEKRFEAAEEHFRIKINTLEFDLKAERSKVELLDSRLNDALAELDAIAPRPKENLRLPGVQANVTDQIKLMFDELHGFVEVSIEVMKKAIGEEKAIRRQQSTYRTERLEALEKQRDIVSVPNDSITTQKVSVGDRVSAECLVTGDIVSVPNDSITTQKVSVGDRVSAECLVTGTPLPTITWSRDGGRLPKDAFQADGILFIPQAKIEDAGTYTCLAFNNAGSVSKKLVLYVRGH